MQIQKLILTNVRTFSHAEFTFQPSMNLLVGINGTGKSTVLDALRIILSQALPNFTAYRQRPFQFNPNDDISIGADWLYANVHFTFLNGEFEEQYEIRQWLKQDVFSNNTDEQRKDLLRLQPTISKIQKVQGSVETDNKPAHIVQKEIQQAVSDFLETRDKIFTEQMKAEKQPVCIYFSPHRSVLDTKRSTSSGQAAAFSDALILERGLRFSEYIDWLLVQQTLALEDNHVLSQRHLTNLNQAVAVFLDGCTNLRAVREPYETLLVDKNNTTLDVRFMSDGERSILTLILETARRLTQANPKLENPTKDGKAVVLIDELDLHLHPAWQRTIVERLTTTFPNCQFICTTHSPQIIGEVPPEQIILIIDGQAQRPNQSLGMDTNWILRHLMGVAERDTETMRKLHEIETLIEAEEYDEAEEKIDKLREGLGEFPELVRLQTQIDMIDFWADEIDDEEDGE